MALQIIDSELPGLSALDAAALSRITGKEQVQLLRFRYQQGKRAVLHVASAADSSAPGSEGVIWFFAGDKAKRLMRRHLAASYDADTGALYESFPDDHRLPELRQFFDRAYDLAPGLTGASLVAAPRLLRYRPGISGTFQCTLDNNGIAFIKVIAKDDVMAIADVNDQLSRRLADGYVKVARCIGVDPRVRAIAYAGASGVSLDEHLCTIEASEVTDVIRRVVSGLQRLNAVSGLAVRELGRDDLISRAEKACGLIVLSDAVAGQLATELLSKLRTNEVEHRKTLIHGDMKIEHVFLNDDCLTFIDTESLSLGDPDYDVAKLEVRLSAASLTGALSSNILIAAHHELVTDVSPNYRWFLNAAILQTAKFFAQRPGAENLMQCRRLLQIYT